MGSVFSPYYARARKRGPADPMQHCALNVALYGPKSRWCMTERNAAAVTRTPDRLQIGPSSMHWDGTALVIRVDEWAVPHLTRMRGEIRVHPQALTSHVEHLDPLDRHRWTPFAPSARVEVTMPSPGLSWSGQGYFDGNSGDVPLETDFRSWTWSRATLPHGAAAVLYDVTRRDGSELALALNFAPDGSVSRIAPPPKSHLPGTLWRVDRTTRADHGTTPRVLHTLEAAPFYTRSAIETTLHGQRVTGVHESLEMDRFTQAWVQTLLPFRMPRLVTKQAADTTNELYRPPAPIPTTPNKGLLRAIFKGERDLIGMLPDHAYRDRLGELGKSRRGILIVSAPELVQKILIDADSIFPKNDLMVGALEGLVGQSIFVSSGAAWRRQRRMVDPAFSQLRVNRAFAPMSAAIDLYETQLDTLAASGTTMALDAGMSHLTADIICRTIFSQPLEGHVTAAVFHDFAAFERSVANVEIRRLLLGRPFADIPQPPKVRAACARIRGHIGDLLDPRLAPNAPVIDDIVGAVIATRDPESGQGFTREELIDQIGVFFLAGHETTASVLTWTFFMLSQQPETVARMRAEIAEVAGDAPITLEHVKHLSFTRNVFREALRLYPPITFIPRVALRDTEIDGRPVKRGTMIMIAPWAIHRHEALWPNPDRFDPDRFAGEREQTPGAYLPFGLGPRICVGAAFATIESALILARLVRRYDFTVQSPEKVRPVARLTTKPASEIRCTIHRT